jgi:hypothetical protein
MNNLNNLNNPLTHCYRKILRVSTPGYCIDVDERLGLSCSYRQRPRVTQLPVLQKKHINDS